jgi:hypothetical protein
MILRRIVPNADPIEVIVQGYSHQYNPDQLTGGVQQGDQRVEILADEVNLVGWPAPPARLDRLVMDRTVAIQGVTPVYDGSVLVGWSLWVRG